MFVLFNNEKQFVGYSEDIPDLPTLSIFKLKLPEEVSDIKKWKWVGDMFNGKMIPIEETPNLGA
jgi:hypothetical protein